MHAQQAWFRVGSRSSTGRDWFSAGVAFQDVFHVRFQYITTHKTKTFQSDLLHVKRISVTKTHRYKTGFNSAQVFSYSFSQLLLFQ